VAGLFWEKSTAGWWLISQTNRSQKGEAVSIARLTHQHPDWSKHCISRAICDVCFVVLYTGKDAKHPRDRSLITQWSLTEPILHTKESRVTSYSFWVSTPTLRFRSKGANASFAHMPLQGFILSSNWSPNSSKIQGIFNFSRY
jgi:hypothetical protein